VATLKGGENIVKTAVDAFGRLDILVNNAGNSRYNDVFNMTEKEMGRRYQGSSLWSLLYHQACLCSLSAAEKRADNKYCLDLRARRLWGAEICVL